MKETHPAMVAARNSWRCVQGKLKDEWLGLMAEDVVIDTLLTALDRGEQLRDATAIRAWLLRIATNRATLACDPRAPMSGAPESWRRALGTDALHCHPSKQADDGHQRAHEHREPPMEACCFDEAPDHADGRDREDQWLRNLHVVRGYTG